MASVHSSTSTSHTRHRSKFSLPSPSTSSDLLTPVPYASSTITGRTPPPSPSPFMRSFYASQPSIPTSQLRPLRRRYGTSTQLLQRIWREQRPHFRRFLLLVVLVLLPTLLIAAYFAGVAATATAAAASYRMVPMAAPISGGEGGPAAGVAVPGGGEGGHSGNLKRRWSGAVVVPRQAVSSIDSADAPVLSLGNGLGNTGTTLRATITDPALSNSNSQQTATPTTTLRTTTAPSVPSNPILPTPFVQPFDTTLSTDFVSATCQTFFANFTQSLSFRQCRPFSLLLPTSQDFITAQSNLTLLTSILYGTCTTTPSADECMGRMNDLSLELRNACAAELGAGHALTWDALNGMKNYQMMRDAGCLRNLRTNAYCFADALAASTPSDVYFYQLPLGTPLPGTSTTGGSSDPPPASTQANSNGNATKVNVTPTCSACTQSLMGIYARYATNDSLLISETYDSAQRLVDATCGSGYASAINGAKAVTAPLSGSRLVVLGMLLSLGVVSLGLGVL